MLFKPIQARMTAGLVSWLLAAGLPSAAVAQSPSPGVHVDPGSPAAKQYSIPLATARGAPPGSGTPSTLFGQGITRASGGSPAGGTAGTAPPAGTTSPAQQGKSRAHKSQAATSGGARPGHAAATPATSAPPALKVLHPGSGSGAVWMLGLAAIVILLGSAGGVLAAGRVRRGSPRAG